MGPPKPKACKSKNFIEKHEREYIQKRSTLNIKSCKTYQREQTQKRATKKQKKATSIAPFKLCRGY